ncbi:MAG: YebC/PmpR family DNA-binding transcriptional regulator, partial [Gammaproteobacteria bacterium]|nr:YebC/PmpR family DNA-binding transcriptional regulator [Gammaproteobacteria bacterium]
EKTLEILLEESFIDLEEGETSFFVELPGADFTATCERLREKGLKLISQEFSKVAITKMPVAGEDEIKLQAFYDKLDTHDDVQALYCNVEWSEDSE